MYEINSRNNLYNVPKNLLKTEAGLQKALCNMEYSDGKISKKEFDAFNTQFGIMVEMCEWANIDLSRFHRALGFNCTFDGSYSPKRILERQRKNLTTKLL